MAFSLKSIFGLLAASPLLFCCSAQAEINTYTDWAVACDNTRHCEAVGFQSEDNDGPSVALFLARDAGSATPVKMSLTADIPEDRLDDEKLGELTITIGKFTLKGLPFEGDLTPAQINALLPHMLNASEADLTDGKSEWVLSLHGLKAALLKMDDQQGRVGTPGALVRKGTKPESSVLPALPAPTLVPAKVASPKPDDEKLLKPILKAVKERDCWEDTPDNEDPSMSIHRLTDTEVLVMRECGRGAYQSGYGAWIADDKPPYSPRKVSFPKPGNQPPDDDVMEADFDKGVIRSYAKGRGLADCNYTASWLWTSEGFKLMEEAASPLCRGIPGGGYSLRTWVTKTAQQ